MIITWDALVDCIEMVGALGEAEPRLLLDALSGEGLAGGGAFRLSYGGAGAASIEMVVAVGPPGHLDAAACAELAARAARALRSAGAGMIGEDADGWCTGDWWAAPAPEREPGWPR